jgi:hypothetical protein
MAKSVSQPYKTDATSINQVPGKPSTTAIRPAGIDRISMIRTATLSISALICHLSFLVLKVSGVTFQDSEMIDLNTET